MGLWTVALNFLLCCFLELMGGLEVELVGSVVQGLQELSGVVKGGGRGYGAVCDACAVCSAGAVCVGGNVGAVWGGGSLEDGEPGGGLEVLF